VGTEKNFIISTLSRPKDIYERCVRKSKANGWALNKLKPALSVMMNKSKWRGRDAAVGGITGNPGISRCAPQVNCHPPICIPNGLGRGPCSQTATVFDNNILGVKVGQRIIKLQSSAGDDVHVVEVAPVTSHIPETTRSVLLPLV
jgi:hypothetical protein